MPRSRLLAAMISLLALLVIAGCGGSSDSPSTSAAPAPASAPPATAPVATSPLTAPTPPATPPTVADAGDFILQFEEPQDPASQETAEALAGSGLFQAIVDELNAELALPHDIPIIFGGSEGPRFSPSDRNIAYPYEFIRMSRDFLASIGTPAEDLERRTQQATVFVFYHELGHALIDAYDLPVTGREEDAADGLATVIAIDALENADVALSGAGLFAGLAASRDPDTPAIELFADEHSLDAVRVLNIACLVYGSNPQEHMETALAIGLPESRLVRCPGEYEQASSSWGKLLAPFLKSGPPPTATSPGPVAPPATTPVTDPATAPVTSPPADTTSGDGFPTAEEADLLATIPESTRSSCVRSDEGSLVPGAVAGVTCDLTATIGHTAVYALFPDAESLNAVYQSAVADSGATQDQGDCATAPPAELSWATGPDASSARSPRTGAPGSSGPTTPCSSSVRRAAPTATCRPCSGGGRARTRAPRGDAPTMRRSRPRLPRPRGRSSSTRAGSP